MNTEFDKAFKAFSNVFDKFNPKHTPILSFTKDKELINKEVERIYKKVIGDIKT